ncbi:protein PTHB1 isoform X2 [Cephus cinctus]|uniref:Protein PTHB1 isoform X1 n=1 Tax=Cephus cinctus TaxID=211228 RepID=A0AAJ7FKC0_CEPCN|nr:protein PTHB1 isoform X1 [Cephus cinctus]XP_015595991.1 protein PTHB1 isoform X2 [Cephus cinctus]
MSLFKSKQWWRTECEVNEKYDKRSLLIAPLFGVDTKDIIIVGSHSGYLRLYSPSSQWSEETKESSGYKSTDLLLETKLADCIVDLKAGKFASGSQDMRLGVLTSTKLIVYSATQIQGSTEHGDRCMLNVAYEHVLTRFPISLTVGPFGGVRSRDFLCVQCVDGTLLFYEQENFTFIQTLNKRLLPSSLIYISRNDVFVTMSSDWILECYKYQNIADSSRSEDHQNAIKKMTKNIEADWSYNLGEGVLDMDVVTLSSFEVGIVILGEKNVYCLRDNCAVKYAKRLEYEAICFHPYVIEPDGKLMVLIATNTGVLMIYEDSSLKWSARLPFVPVALVKANFQHLQGAIVMLSDDGRLEAFYLGTQPSLFVAPPLHRRKFDHAEGERELALLRKRLRRSASFGNFLDNARTESELSITVRASPHPDICNYEANEMSDQIKGCVACKVTLELSSYSPLQDVQIYLNVSQPLTFNQDKYAIPNLCDRQVLQTMIYTNGRISSMSSEAQITATYGTRFGSQRIVRKTIQLPLRLFLNPTIPENTGSFSTIVKSSEVLVNFGQLFPEFVGEYSLRQNNSALGLQHILSGSVVTILYGATSNRYRILSSVALASTLVIEQLLLRLCTFSSSQTFKASISQDHFQLVYSQIDAHFSSRQRVKRITDEIVLLTTQMRNIERRMLWNFRERNLLHLETLTTLLDFTYSSIFSLLDELIAANAERDQTTYDLQCAIRLLFLLVRFNASDDKYILLRSAIGFETQLRNDVGWEELADLGLTTLLKTISRKSDIDSNRAISWFRFETVKDLSKLKRRIVHAVEKLNKDSNVIDIES